MRRYPHEFAVERRNPAGDGLWHECRCGAVLGRVPGDDDCPAALRERVEALEQHVGSLHKAQARGYEAGRRDERDAVSVYLRDAAEGASATHPVARDAMRRVLALAATAIELGKHREEG